MSERLLELASPEWIEALKEMLREHVRKCPDFSATLCEVYVNVPKHLDRDGTGRISWHAFISNGQVDFRDGEIDNADLKAIADYDLVRTRVRKLWGDDPALRAEHEAKLAEAIAEGRLKREGDWDKIPPEMEGIHDRMGKLTA